MITIFHGDDLLKSRTAFLDRINSQPEAEILRIEGKNIDPDKINNFLNAGSLFPGKKILCIDNYFAIPKSVQEKILKILTKSEVEVLIWHDKTATAAQLKTLPDFQSIIFKASNSLFTCLNSLKPKNLIRFQPLYDRILKEDLFDLFLYLLKGNFRKQLQTMPRFDINLLKKTYLQLIELEYQFKSGQLSLPRETALNRVLINLMK